MNRLLLLAFFLAMMAVATLGSREEEEEDSVARSAREADPGRTARKGVGRSIKSCMKQCSKQGRGKQCRKECKKRGNKRKGDKGPRRPNKSQKCRAGRTDNCMDTVTTYMATLLTKIPNYIRQQNRIVNANKTGGTKNGKTAAFATAAQKIVQAGGGNMTALSCNGDTNSTGAAKLLSMATSLKACAKSIDTACNPKNLPLPNMTEVAACVANMELFQTAVNACIAASPQLCSCYEDSAITDLKAKIKVCSIVDENREMSAVLKGCKKNFTSCKKMEDEGMQAAHACSISTTSMVADAAALTANSAGLAAAQATTAALTATNTTRKMRAAVTTCAEVIATNTKILAAVDEMPTSATIATLCATVTNISVTCTDAEKASLTTQDASLTAAKDTVDSNLASVQSALETATGTTASPAAIAAGGASGGATAASGSRRNIVARHLLNRLNLK